jgi:hypothetical protein
MITALTQLLGGRLGSPAVVLLVLASCSIASAVVCPENDNVVCPANAESDSVSLMQPATNPKYAYFNGCGNWETFASAETARQATTLSPCQQNVLESPFDHIIYSFVNGRQIEGERIGRVNPFKLDFIQ